MFLLRLALDFVALGLLLAALAYWWLDNRTHELIGTAMFLLLIVHNVFNRWWYGTIRKGRRAPRGLMTTVLNLSLLTVMLTLLITSLMISRDLFGFISLESGFTVREIHKLASYWAMVIVSIHLGLHWSMVMGAVRGALDVAKENRGRTWALRMTAVAVAAYGVHSSFEMRIGSKLVLHPTLDMWDFGESTLGFFAHYGAIVGLYAVLAHYAVTWMKDGRRKREPREMRRHPGQPTGSPPSHISGQTLVDSNQIRVAECGRITESLMGEVVGEVSS
jgi:hypothetical protein